MIASQDQATLDILASLWCGEEDEQEDPLTTTSQYPKRSGSSNQILQNAIVQEEQVAWDLP